jgi:hypothetical protein
MSRLLAKPVSDKWTAFAIGAIATLGLLILFL